MRKRPSVRCTPPAAGGGPVAEKIDVADVYQIVDTILAAGDRLPRDDRPPIARRALAGHLFEEAPLFVSQVSRVLRTRGELFEDVHVDPDSLDHQQRRALAWQGLQETLLELARIAGALYVQDQAGAVQDAMSVLRQVRGDEERPFPHPLCDERRRALGQAEEVLADRQVRKRRQAARRARAEASRAAAPEGTLVQTPAATPARDRHHGERAAAKKHLRRVEAWLIGVGE